MAMQFCFGARISIFSSNQDIETLDAVLITHQHWDHAGALYAVHNHFSILEVYISGRRHWLGYFESYLTALQDQRIPVYKPQRGETTTVGHLEFQVLNPPENVDDYSLNNTSLVLRLQYGEVGFLFTGDMEAPMEKELLSEDVFLEADNLKVAHHGLSTSSTAAFLEAVDPTIAIIQDTLYSFLRPWEVCIQHELEYRVIQVFRNAHDGHLVLYTDGVSYTLKKEESRSSTPVSVVDDCFRMLHGEIQCQAILRKPGANKAPPLSKTCLWKTAGREEN